MASMSKKKCSMWVSFSFSDFWWKDASVWLALLPTSNVTELGETKRHDEERCFGKLTQPIPNWSQIASTRFLVFSSISIKSGQGRVNPSSFHLRVASMPIFEP